MKKLFCLALVAALVTPVFADEEEEDQVSEDAFVFEPAVGEENVRRSTVWPSFLAIGNIPSGEIAPEIIGLRLTIPCSTVQDSVTGFDIGFWGRARTFEGIMVNLLRNDAVDRLSGFQIGLYNSADCADAFGLQAGLWNGAGSLCGIQAGLINEAEQVSGLQVGLINCCEELYGLQVGVINIIRDGELPFFPVFNIGF